MSNSLAVLSQDNRHPQVLDVLFSEPSLVIWITNAYTVGTVCEPDGSYLSGKLFGEASLYLDTGSPVNL